MAILQICNNHIYNQYDPYFQKGVVNRRFLLILYMITIPNLDNYLNEYYKNGQGNISNTNEITTRQIY